MIDLVVGALVAARDYLRAGMQDSVTYGFFPGGDPRDFTPDPECCTEAELAAHKQACEEWERGDRKEYERHRHEATEQDGKVMIASYAGAFGLGTYSTRDDAADDVLEQLDAALASLTSREGVKGEER